MNVKKRPFPIGKIQCALISLLGASVIFLTGCQSVQVAPVETQQKAANFTPPAGKSYLYVLRTARYVAGGVSFGVALDTQVLGKQVSGSYLFAEIPPGQHRLYLTSLKNYGAWLPAPKDAAEFTTEAGKNYFINIEPKMHWGSGHVDYNYIPLTEVDGEAKIEKLKLSGDIPFRYSNSSLTDQLSMLKIGMNHQDVHRLVCGDGGVYYIGSFEQLSDWGYDSNYIDPRVLTVDFYNSDIKATGLAWHYYNDRISWIKTPYGELNYVDGIISTVVTPFYQLNFIDGKLDSWNSPGGGVTDFYEFKELSFPSNQP